MVKDVDKKTKETKSTKEIKETVKQNVQNKMPQKIELTPQMAERLFNEERKKLDTLNNDLRNIESNIFELEKTNFALKEIKDSKEKEMYINLGQGVFIKAKLEETKKVNVMNPSKVLFTKDINDALKELEDKKKILIENQKKLRSLYMQTEKNVNQLYTFLNKMQKKQ